MGGSSSKSNVQQNINNNTVNTNTVDNVNKSIMNAGVEVLVKNANTCSTAVNQNNLCKMTDVTSTGDFNYNANQTNIAKVNFACVNSAEASSQMATEMVKKMMGQLNTLSNTSAGAKLNAASSAENNSGFGGSGTSKSSTSSNVTNKLTNDTKTVIENLYENNLKSNFTADTVNQCIGKTTQSNISDIGNIKTGGSANVECVQTNSLEQVQECKQLAESLNKSFKKTAEELGFKITSENEAASETEAKAETESKNVSTGPIQEIGTAIAGILGGIFGIMMAPAIASTVSFFIVCLCSVIMSIVFAMMGGKPEHIGQAGKYLGNKAESLYAATKNMKPNASHFKLPLPTSMNITHGMRK